MKIASIKINNYKRLKGVSFKIQQDVTALIGPNEAGKSSILSALFSLEREDGEEFLDSEITRDAELAEDSTIVQIRYTLDSEDVAAMESISPGVYPSSFTILREKNGTIKYLTEESSFSKDFTLRKNVISIAQKILSNKTFSKRIDVKMSEEIDDEETHYYGSVKDYCSSLIKEFSSKDINLESEVLKTIEEFSNFLREIDSFGPTTYTNSVRRLVEATRKAIIFEKHPKMQTVYRKHCFSKRPKFVFYSQEERDLKSSYSLEELRSPPKALKNLASVASLNLEEIVSYMESGNDPKLATQSRKTNNELKKIYEIEWSQSDVYPYISLTKSELHVHFNFIEELTDIRERSDGMREFVTLRNFLSSENLETPPILLIDEAETHLHYDAQADLIKVFESGVLSSSVIYTTHSVGCLPSDLGAGVKPVVKILNKENKDSGESRVASSIWENTHGTTPILYAMGASTLALSSFRSALITEGVTEVSLLPRILRSACNLTTIPIQILPGIAVISTFDAAALESSANQVAYLVDGDQGGKANKKKLVDGGVKGDKILLLKNKSSIEDYLNPQLLIQTMSELAKEFGLNHTDYNMIAPKSLPKEGRIDFIRTKVSGDVPDKKSIASRISSLDRSISVHDSSQGKYLEKLYQNILALTTTSPSPPLNT